MLAMLERPLDMALVLGVGDQQLVSRLAQRAHMEHRGDDTPEVIAERLRIYREQTEPVLEYLAQTVPVVRIDGSQSVEEVSQELARAIG
jgi:adenylate kinase